MKIGKVVFCFLFFVCNWEWVALRRPNGKSRGFIITRNKNHSDFFLSV